MSVVSSVENYFGQPFSDCFDIVNVAPDGNCGFSAAQIFLEYAGTISTATTINDFRCSISDYIKDNIVGLATCTAAADWRIGDEFTDKISILQQYQRTIYNPKKNYIGGCSQPDWFMDQWFSLVGKQFNFSTLLFLDDLAMPEGGFASRPPLHIDANGFFDIQYDNTASQNLHPTTENNRHNILYCVFVAGTHYMWLRPK
jgi:hypothetical protein